MSQFLNDFVIRWTGVIRGAGILVAVFIVLMVYARTKSFVAMIVALVTAGVFLWGITNTAWFSTKAGQEATGGGNALRVPAPAGGGGTGDGVTFAAAGRTWRAA